jgi:Fur family ferric uptake transcriptional regulator
LLSLDRSLCYGERVQRREGGRRARPARNGRSRPGRKRAAARPTAVDLRGEIRGAGLRGTAPRVAVLDRLRRAEAPLSHAEITKQLTHLGFDRATIYRNLVDLAEAGLLARVDVGDHVWRYEVRLEESREDAEHPHFVCNDCGTVACLPSVSVNIRPAPGSAKSVVAAVSEVVLKGRCEHC